ncbi:hypothetical protein QUV50_09270 [Phascolarctobacterium faecium]|nr:hypothetical protein [Phascolarctobacterium faecium]MDM8111971.1 hypothetical protein [Phascolarctobacterium faecium]
MSGIWSRGYHGDCRDCIHYNSYHLVKQNEWKCDYSGDYFNDEYGSQCHCFEDIEEINRIKEEKRRKKEETDFLIYDFLLGGNTFSHSNDTDDINYTEHNTKHNNGFSLKILIPLYLVVGFFIDSINTFIYDYSTILGHISSLLTAFLFCFFITFSWGYSSNKSLKENFKDSITFTIIFFIIFLIYSFWSYWH